MPEYIDKLLASYPRTRPALPPEHAKSYVDHYQVNRAGKQGLSKIVQGLEAWMHRRIAQGVTGGEILEVGAGNLNHLPYQKEPKAYDAIEPFRELWVDNPACGSLRNMYSDITEIPVEPLYDQVLSVAVLEHLTDLPFILARSGLLLRPGGKFRAGFPSEGGLLWGLSWRYTTGIQYRLKRGLDYGAIMRHEHVNKAREILDLLDYFYEEVEVARFPLPAAHLSFYTAAVAGKPRLERCRAVSARGTTRS